MTLLMTMTRFYGADEAMAAARCRASRKYRRQPHQVYALYTSASADEGERWMLRAARHKVRTRAGMSSSRYATHSWLILRDSGNSPPLVTLVQFHECRRRMRRKLLPLG